MLQSLLQKIEEGSRNCVPFCVYPWEVLVIGKS